jgi:pimeloyl-ACP methyl ester carboxylesterase
MDVIYDRAPGRNPDRIMLVMLPSAKARPQDLVEHGFVRALRELKLHVDVVIAEAHLGYYLERSFTAQLQDIIAPARARDYQRVWLMGISLGGMGALLYASEHPAEIEGVVVLAPFLGARGTIAEVVRAGGLARWQPGAMKTDDDERRLLAWIKAYQPAAALPAIYLGYGTEDRFAAASKLLEERLPASQVVSVAGAHDWATWLRLWRDLLDQDVFCSAGKTARKRAPVQKTLAVT